MARPASIIGGDPRNLDLSIIASMPVTLQEIKTELGTIDLRCGVEGVKSGHAVHLDRITYAVIRPRTNGTLLRMLDEHVRQLQDLLTVTTGRTSELVRLRLRPIHTQRFGRQLVEALFPVTQPAQLVFNRQTAKDRSSELLNYTAPTLCLGSDKTFCVNCIVRGWSRTWSTHQTVVALLLGRMYAPFMYSLQRYSLIFQAVEALHSLDFAGRELAPVEHRKRVDGIVRAAVDAGCSSEDLLWARSVLTRNDKPLRLKVEEVVASTGSMGSMILDRFPDFGRAVAKLRGEVSHPSPRNGDVAAGRFYWYGEILGWVTRSVLLRHAGLCDAADRAAGRFPFREALDRLLEIEKAS